MGYDSTIFLKPYNSEDKNLLLYDDSGVLKYTINPFSISNVQIRGNIITLSIKNGRTILLDFLNNNYASNALPLLQDRIKLLTREKSVHIDRQIQNWVQYIVGTSSPTNSNSDGARGDIRVDHNQYLYIHTGEQWVRSSVTFSTF